MNINAYSKFVILKLDQEFLISMSASCPKVHQVYDGEPGCVVVSTNPLVILAGDGFSQSTFDGCLDSAEAVLSAVKTHFKGGLDSGL